MKFNLIYQVLTSNLHNYYQFHKTMQAIDHYLFYMVEKTEANKVLTKVTYLLSTNVRT